MKKKILFADDEEDIIKLVSARLKSWGFEVFSARDGKAALELAKKEKPDLILLDVTMPFLNGLEVSKKIKEDEHLKHIPVILLTASTKVSTPEVLKLSLADDFIIKPFESAHLKEKIERLINKQNTC